jgi:membrane associated rhomboid family serine protease
MLSRLPPATRALLIANVLVFLAQHFLFRPFLDEHFALWPWLTQVWVDSGAPGFMPWQVLSYGFLHADLAHLLLNMLALVMFGAQLEHAWGTRRFTTYFLICVAGAGLIQFALASWSVSAGETPYPTVGASGGVFGLLLGYGMMFPNQRVMLLIPPVPMKARTLVLLFGAIALLLGFTGLQPGVAHFAHLGGMVFGWLTIRYWRRSSSPRPPSSGGGSKRTHLRVVK